MPSLNGIEAFVVARAFKRGRYEVEVSQEKSAPHVLLSFAFDRDDEQAVRRIPSVLLPRQFEPYERSLVASALVRAGAQHPGLRAEDLANLHREASREHHVELFTDLNALTTGLLEHVVRSLDGAVARVVISSSSIDILHEYQGRIRKSTAQSGDFRRRAELARALRLLEELRRAIPVHVHQLPPGATRYFARSSGGPLRPPEGGCDGEDTADLDDLTFISEDRQMIAAYWDYMTRANTRLPVRLITSDFALAHVCVAERVPFLFARSPYDVWRSDSGAAPHEPRILWLDPFALALRCATPHAILWELCAVFERVTVRPGEGAEDTAFSLVYDPRSHLPGSAMIAWEEPAPLDESARGAEAGGAVSPERSSKKPTKTKKKQSATAPSKGVKTPSKSAKPAAPSARALLTIRLPLVLDVLPTKPGERTPLAAFRGKDNKALKELQQLGEETGLYHVGTKEIEGGPALADLLTKLDARDYLGVNAIFRKVRAYDEALRQAADSGTFASTKSGGATTGWAVILGAAYKTNVGALDGLADVSETTFAEAIERAHNEAGQGHQAVPLPDVLDRVCRALRYSPARFEATLDKVLGDGTLRGYEPQRASVSFELPEHDVLVGPTVADIGHFLRHLAPGKGVVLGGVLVSSLVRQSGDL
jgi:hypothetical protein